jgi:surfactin synthase thioesterase subunit
MSAVTLSHNTVESGRRGREVRLRLFCFPYAGRAPQLQRSRPHLRDLTEPALLRELRELKGVSEQVLLNRELLEDHAAWIAQTRRSFSLHMFPGDHLFLHSAKEGLLSALFHQLQTLVCVEGGGQLAYNAGLSAARWTEGNSRSLQC